MLFVAAFGKLLDNHHCRSAGAVAALVAAAFHLVYSAATIVTVFRGIPLPDCGCFGIFFQHPLDWTMAIEDMALAGVCLLLYRLGLRESKKIV